MQKILTSPPAQIEAGQLPMLALLLLFDSMHFIFARLLLPYVSPNVSAMYVMIVATIQVGIYGVATGQLGLAALRNHWRFFLIIGLLIGISTHLGFIAIGFIDVGTAAMLNQISTVFSVGFGLFWLREHFSPIQLLGTGIAIVGSFVIAYQPDARLQWGALLIIVGSFCYSLHFAIVKRHGSQIDFVNFFFYRILSTALLLFLSAAGRQVFELAFATRLAGHSGNGHGRCHHQPHLLLPGVAATEYESALGDQHTESGGSDCLGRVALWHPANGTTTAGRPSDPGWRAGGDGDEGAKVGENARCQQIRGTDLTDALCRIRSTMFAIERIVSRWNPLNPFPESADSAPTDYAANCKFSGMFSRRVSQ